jgi:hypothetical protein
MPGPERITVREVGHEPHGAKGVIAGWHVDFRSGGPDVRIGSRPCENVREPRKRRTVFSIAFFG